MDVELCRLPSAVKRCWRSVVGFMVKDHLGLTLDERRGGGGSSSVVRGGGKDAEGGMGTSTTDGDGKRWWNRPSFNTNAEDEIDNLLERDEKEMPRLPSLAAEDVPERRGVTDT